MKLSIIVPVYNERDTILPLLERVRALDVEKEILVIDNCSTDGTHEILESLEQDADFRVIFHPTNMGKGSSIRTGLSQAGGEWVIIQDADLEYDPRDIPRLLARAEAGAEAVFGSRFLGGLRGGGPWVFSLGRRVVAWLFRVLYRCSLTDMATCYKLVRRERMQGLNLRCSGFDLDCELAAKLRRTGVQIAEVPISYTPRTGREGKKITVRDGVITAWRLLQFRFCRIRKPA